MILFFYGIWCYHQCSSSTLRGTLQHYKHDICLRFKRLWLNSYRFSFFVCYRHCNHITELQDTDGLWRASSPKVTYCTYLPPWLVMSHASYLDLHRLHKAHFWPAHLHTTHVSIIPIRQSYSSRPLVATMSRVVLSGIHRMVAHMLFLKGSQLEFEACASMDSAEQWTVLLYGLQSGSRGNKINDIFIIGEGLL